jgi:hypothetical protein
MNFTEDIKNQLAKDARIGNGLELGESQIEGAGMGVFATRTFVRGDIITYYEGPIIDWKRLPPNKAAVDYFPERITSHAKMLYALRYTILGNVDDDMQPLKKVSTKALKGRGGTAFLNDAGDSDYYNNTVFDRIVGKDTSRKIDSQQRNELVLDPRDVAIVIRARVNIGKGQELFVDYGEDYWTRNDTRVDVDDQLTTEELRNAIYRPQSQPSAQKKNRRVAPERV